MATKVLTTAIVAILMGCAAFMTMFLFYANIVTEYADDLNFTMDDDFNETYVQMSEELDTMGSDVSVQSQNYLDTTGGTSTTSIGQMILNGYGVVKSSMKMSITAVTKILPNIATKIGIPTFWLTAILSIIIITILIAIVSGLFRITNW